MNRLGAAGFVSAALVGAPKEKGDAAGFGSGAAGAEGADSFSGWDALGAAKNEFALAFGVVSLVPKENAGAAAAGAVAAVGANENAGAGFGASAPAPST